MILFCNECGREFIPSVPRHSHFSFDETRKDVMGKSHLSFVSVRNLGNEKHPFHDQSGEMSPKSTTFPLRSSHQET
jgi:hypothetical protein